MQLGSLSEKYESRGNPGAVSRTQGDKGGPSYGLYQLSLNAGSLKHFITYSRFKEEFKGLQLGSKGFDRKWIQVAQIHRAAFEKDQRDYHKRTYFDPTRKLADSLNVPDTNAINQVLWSTATQHGVGWTKRRLRDTSQLTEVDFIKAIYQYRKEQFKNSDYYNSTSKRKRILKNVLQRFNTELEEALKLIKGP